MSVQTSPKAQEIKAKLKAHADETARLHGELREYAGTLDEKRAAGMRKAVDEHERADNAFAGDALACVPPTG